MINMPESLLDFECYHLGNIASKPAGFSCFASPYFFIRRSRWNLQRVARDGYSAPGVINFRSPRLH
jgi:hypothetical protein